MLTYFAIEALVLMAVLTAIGAAMPPKTNGIYYGDIGF
jgi:hypothetical protein